MYLDNASAVWRVHLFVADIVPMARGVRYVSLERIRRC